MRKIIISALAGAMILCLAACTDGKQLQQDFDQAAVLSDQSEEANMQETISEEANVQETMSEEVNEQDAVSAEAEVSENQDDLIAESEETEAVEGTVEAEPVQTEEVPVQTASGYVDGQEIYLQNDWEFAENSVIHTGYAIMYTASENRKDIIVGINAGHGTSGGQNASTYCHPDHSAKTTGGSTSAGSVKAAAVSGGMTFRDGTGESTVTLQMAQILRDKLLAEGYDVLMVRDGEDVQLDNIARTVICNNVADCHIALHWDGDGLDYDKGCFYCSVPDGIKGMYPVSGVWQQDDALGSALITGLEGVGAKIHSGGSVAIDLTQTSYSTVPSVDIELGNQSSVHDSVTLANQADGLTDGINLFFRQN